MDSPPRQRQLHDHTHQPRPGATSGPHGWQLGGADHPQARPPALTRSHPLQRAALLGADRAAAASNLHPLIPSLFPLTPHRSHDVHLLLRADRSLSAPLDRAKVRQREQGRSKVSYLEGWQVIAEANRIFGFDGWQRETIEVRCVSQAERTIGRDQRPGWGVTYTARVRVTVGGPTSAAAVIREGCGAGHGIDADLGQAHESALKEAETDAMKRALMTFGNPFGLALYDKQQREVTSSAGESSAPRTASASNGTRSIHRSPRLLPRPPLQPPAATPA